MDATTTGELRYAKNRLESLSDGIFAVAMTLMAFEIKVPELPKSVSEEELLTHLRTLVPAVGVYLMAFILLSAYWFLHHSIYHHIKHVRRGQILLGLMFLVCVMLQPFSTALMTRFLHHSIALQLYYGNLFVIGLLLLAQWRFAVHDDPSILNAQSRRISYRVASFSIGSAAALIGGTFAPELASYCLISGFLAVRIFERVTRDVRARAEA